MENITMSLDCTNCQKLSKRIKILETENGEYFSRLEVLKDECKSLNDQRDVDQARVKEIEGENARLKEKIQEMYEEQAGIDI